MKILVVQDYLRSGGTERQSVFLSNAFARAGHATTLLTFRPGGQLAGTVSADVRRVILQPFDTHLDWFAPGLFRTVERERPDITLCMGRMANCYGYAIANVLRDRSPRSAVVCTMRTGKPLPSRYQRSLRVAGHVVTNSTESRDCVVDFYGISAAKVSVIYNSLVFASPSAASPDATAKVRAEVRLRWGASSTSSVLLCVAMFRPEKNQRELVELVAGLPADRDIQLWLAGDGSAREACERLVREQHLEDRVKFLGFHRDPSALYTAADVAVHASASESLSNFLIEAQAHGLPAVAYAAQGIGECFVPERTGWVIARDDRDAFRARLLALQSEPTALRAARSAEAQHFARSTFDSERQVAAYLELFARLTGSPRA